MSEFEMKATLIFRALFFPMASGPSGENRSRLWTSDKYRFKEHVDAAKSGAGGMTINMRMSVLFACVIVCAVLLAAQQHVVVAAESPPNILFCISDDQSYAHTGANGDPIVKTPAFDQIAREGIRFTHAFCDAPSCGPSRSAILTGRPIWGLEEAGNIHSTLPAKFATYTEMLQSAGYVIGPYREGHHRSLRKGSRR